jgi:GNAT superfamily N-acetyltransferase
MTNPQRLAQDFLNALSSTDPARYEAVLSEEVGLRLNRWDGREIYRPRKRVMQRFMDEWASWPDPTLEGFEIIATGNRVALEYRIQAMENQRYVEHNRSAFLTIQAGKIQTIDLYCPESIPSARRKGWIAPATLTDEELRRLFESTHNSFDAREWISPNANGRFGLRGGRWGSGDAHPGSNGIGGVHWTAEEADRRIEETIAYHRERHIGFQWWVNADNTPSDLGARLEKQGLVLAGDVVTMARLGLDQIDIPINPEIMVETLDGYDDEAIDALCDIDRECFHSTQEQIDERRTVWVARMRHPKFREIEINYLARVKGKPVAFARLMLAGGMAYLGGAGTLPEFRGQHVYSTLMRRRLEDARARGYQLAVINAGQLSRPIATRCGFKEYARDYVYGWMPVIDLNVIKSLLPQE